MSFSTQIAQQSDKEDSVFTIDYEGGACELNLVTRHSNNDCTFRINRFVETLTGEQILKSKLNLTATESEVLYWLSNGKTNKEIAIILTIASRAVNKHLEQVFAKLSFENRPSSILDTSKTPSIKSAKCSPFRFIVFIDVSVR